jgi:Icc-related predicted phosphoesterase
MIRIAAVGDLHYSKTNQDTWQPLFAQIDRAADILLLCGDLTDYGLVEEAQGLTRELTEATKIPVVAVLGNHDYEAGREADIRAVLAKARVQVLDGETCEVQGIGFAGAKGFAGGFGRGTLGSWGEMPTKAFVQEAINEALKLEAALARLRTAHRIALLHYSPVRSTVNGEPCEIFPYLGTSRLEEPLDRYPVTAVFHGHAHNGTLEGRTLGDVPVFNVALPLLRRQSPEQPFKIWTIRTLPERLDENT